MAWHSIRLHKSSGEDLDGLVSTPLIRPSYYSKLAPTIGSTSRQQEFRSTNYEGSPPTEDDTVEQAVFSTEPASPCMELSLIYEADVLSTPPCPSLLQRDPFLSSIPSGPSTQSNACFLREDNWEDGEKERSRQRFQNGYDVDGDHRGSCSEKLEETRLMQIAHASLPALLLARE